MKRKLTSLLLLILTLPVFAASEEAKIISFNGKVEARLTREGGWSPAAENMEVPEGGAVRSGADGSALLLMPNKTKIWIKETSSLEIEQRQTLSSRLALVFGKIKLRVPHLLRKEKFEVRTPSAVCAVRGTEFTVDTNEAGAMVINVLFGEVKLNFVVPPEKGGSQFYIPQGRSMGLEEKGKPAKLTLMSHDQERTALENWNPGLTQEERQKDLKTKDNDRALIREFARIANGTDDAVQSFLNTVKESDLEGGRTLKDIHGNVVRVDQRMMRPSSDEVQVINLVKRPVYSNDNASVVNGGFKYNGAQGISDRLDYMQMTMKFDQNLPQSIEDWPSFFNDNTINAKWASFVMANKTKPGEIFFVANGAQYDSASDSLKSGTGIVGVANTSAYSSGDDVLITGVLKTDVSNPGGVTAVQGLNNIARLNITDSGLGDGTLKYSAVNDVSPIGLGSMVNGASHANGDVVWASKISYDSFYGQSSGPTGWTNSYEKKGDPYLFDYTATPYAVGGVNRNTNKTAVDPNGYTGIIWFTQESAVINNAGNIQQVSDFTNSSLDPFSILKNSAGEVSMSVKKNGAAPANWTSEANIYTNAVSQADRFDYGGLGTGVGTNVDLVIIPDLLVAAVQRLLPALTKLNK